MGHDVWIAPKVEAIKPYDHKADFRSLGCLLVELMGGEDTRIVGRR